MHIRVIGFKPFNKGSVRGFFSLGYGGLVVKNCRLMESNNGLWFSFPQQKGADDEGNVKYFDQLYLTQPEQDFVRKLVIADLQAQGVVEKPASTHQKQTNGHGHGKPYSQPRGNHLTPEGEDLSEHYSSDQDDDGDIPF